MGNTLNDLKDELFDVMQRLKCHDEEGIDPKDTISLEVAEKMIDCAKQLVEIAKVECTALKIVSNSSDPVIYAEGNGLLSVPKNAKRIED